LEHNEHHITTYAVMYEHIRMVNYLLYVNLKHLILNNRRLKVCQKQTMKYVKDYVYNTPRHACMHVYKEVYMYVHTHVCILFCE